MLLTPREKSIVLLLFVFLFIIVGGVKVMAFQQGSEVKHQVKSGETLWQIARNYNVNMDSLIKLNYLDNINKIQPGQMITIRPGKLDNFLKPVNGRISSYFGMRWGRMHEGLDYAIPVGTNVRASMTGKVVWSGWVQGYGNTVILDHGNGVRTLYGHNSKLIAQSGQWVKANQVVAKSGNTGRSTGPHLHFEIQINGHAVNPLNYLA